MKFKYEQLHGVLTKVFMKIGLNESDSLIASKVLLRSDFTGVNSHGINRLENYIYKLRNNNINLNPIVTKENDSNIVKKLNGDNGLGLVVAPRAVEICIETAKEYGISCVTINNSNHFGVGNYYGNEIAKNDMIGIVITNATPSMAPFGGVDKLLGTNPVVVSIPTKNKNKPIILDMATSAVAFGAIEQLARKGLPLEDGWAMDLEGNITLDAQRVLDGEGMLMPMAKHKGYGLALIVDLLCFALADGKKGDDIVSLRAKGDNLENEGVGHIFLAIDISKFKCIDEFKTDVDEYISFIKNSKRKAGIDEIFMPGEIEYNKLMNNLKEGIELNNKTYEYLERLLKDLEIIKQNEKLEDIMK